MSDSYDTKNHQDSSFLHRWSRRKLAQEKQTRTQTTITESVDPQPAIESPAMQELPEVDSLGENSEVSMFFSEHVSESLKRQALRKLFHMNKFNFVDGLDDYAEDYTLFEPLGNTITAHQRLQKEREELKRLAGHEEERPGQKNEQDDQPATQLADNNAGAMHEESAGPEQEPDLPADQTAPQEGESL